MVRTIITNNKGNILMELVDSKNNVIRKVNLVEGNEYIINPIHYHKKNRGRKVILQEFVRDRYGTYAKVKYLDSLRIGKVEVDDLDQINQTLIGVNDHEYIKGESIIKGAVFDELAPFFQVYMDILNLIDDRKDASNIAFITQREIAADVSLSPSRVSERMKQLIRYGAIIQHSPGAYKLLYNDLLHTPYRTTQEVVILAINKPELNYKEQAEILNVSMNDISRAWAYVNMI